MQKYTGPAAQENFLEDGLAWILELRIDPCNRVIDYNQKVLVNNKPNQRYKCIATSFPKY